MNKLKLLIVEDEEVLKLMLERIIKMTYPDVDILTASDGMEGLDHFKRNKDIDLILTDINMDRMNGFEMIKELSLQYVNLPKIIIMSAWPDNEKTAKGIPYVSRYLHKPFNKNILIPVLNDVCPKMTKFLKNQENNKNSS